MKNLITYLIGAFFIMVPTVVFGASWPGDSGIEIGGNLGAGYEPSGAVWHEERGTLFIVGDDGDNTEMDSDGTIVNSLSPGGDYEGVTVADSESDYIYIGVENPDTILEVDISGDPWVLSGKSWDLTSWMSSTDPNQGLEALTYINDHFYAGLQEDGKIYVFDINREVSGDVSFVETITLQSGLTDISGLDYQSDTETLYAIFDGANKLFEADKDGNVSAEYDLPGNDQEGVALNPGCPDETTDIYIAEDLGPELWKYGSFPIDAESCSSPTPPTPPTPTDVYTANVKGKYLKVYKNDELLKKKKVFKKKQDKTRVKIYDYYNDDRYEIIVTSLLGRKGKIKTYRLTVAGKINFRQLNKLKFKKKKKNLSISLRPNKNQFITKFGKKEYFWKMKRKGKFK